ncbi:MULTISPECIES: OPT family oligopeptide transporter [Petrimonas]|jgi:putative OPT family oligopeptide transporter|uniref:OPT family oligopeptide transporter n=1 Tax=Petrimonas mucosa TaxID=1642646 RepID=A0A1G4G5W6_9BACT|nr:MULTISPECIES: oligopeptide transporter, OPT family [Petrimonas]MDD3561093.1 oligopeptide transporter, OPT family [Petrimonas mucosa]SCM56940.1 OPT family oligopeptide transporter {ECO:0000313/EMBL:CEA15442,1} [Petrimonas mucosa]SFU38880.1 putative oligopeptide transporter, OPT family [Porphyromonadaceae bacterium KHP3R9]HHT29705.1 oligopeptide transporter, OPT family [Petrimonas mucosa]
MQSNQDDKQSVNLPENAYSELREGEEYRPVLPADRTIREITPWSVGMGLLMAIIFSAAAAYSGLKIGQVFEAAIPISIIAVGASAAFRRKNALGQNVIIQSIGASSGVIVAGAVFTIPGLYILQAKYPEIQVDFWQIFFSSLLGGFLGILFLIPFRKYFVKEMHGKLPFPEATATTEILMTGEKGGNQAKLLVTSGLIGGVFDFCFSAFRLWSEEISTRIIPAGAMLADKFKMVLKFNVSALIFSFGYLVGLRYALIITVGSLLSWLVLIPLVNEIGALAAVNGGMNPFAAMSAEEIFATYVRPIGIGAIAMAGIIGIIKSSGVIGNAFKLAVGGGKGKTVAAEVREERTQRDLKMSFVMLFLFLTLVAVFIFLLTGVKVTLVQAIVALLTVTLISFLFTTVAANAIAIVGTNPVSGMTLMTLILSSVILVAVGLKGWQGMVSGLIIGGIVCTALSMAGGFVTDLKIGYWIGTTPAKQETFKFLGTLVSAATVGAVIFILNEAYGFVATETHTNPMVAPQANAMAAIIEPLMSGSGVSWMLLGIGAVISILVNWLNISPLAFALGMFIPLPLNTPLVVGGLLNHWINKRSKDPELNNARHQRAILIASGFIAGAALFGVIGALVIFITGNGNALNLGVWEDPEGTGAQVTALVAFIALIGYFIWESMRAKK